MSLVLASASTQKKNSDFRIRSESGMIWYSTRFAVYTQMSDYELKMFRVCRISGDTLYPNTVKSEMFCCVNSSLQESRYLCSCDIQYEFAGELKADLMWQ